MPSKWTPDGSEDFLELFGLCVMAETDDLERWAFETLKAKHRAEGFPPEALFPRLREAARMRIEREPRRRPRSALD